MDSPPGTLALSASAAGSSSLEYAVTAPLLLLALCIWAIEVRQRWGHVEAFGPRMKACAGLLRGLLPELSVLAVLGAVTVLLLLRGGNNGAPITTQEDQQMWQEIQKEWPVLTTADSLVAIQAMLRLVLLGSAILRKSEAKASPLAGEPATFFLLAAASRVALLALSPADVYHLDGPLGGAMNVVMEVAALPALAYLSLCSRQQGTGWARWLAVGACTLMACWVAKSNRLALADPQDSHLDTLFSLANIFEFFAAAAFLACSVCAGGAAPDCGPFHWFVYTLLPLMQMLPVYFLLTAWGAGLLQSVPELVGAGHPFEVLQFGGATQVGMYLFAGSMKLAFHSATQAEAAAFLLV